MNWIDYSKEKPKAEMKIRVRLRGGYETVMRAYHLHDYTEEEVTHWAEIEGPGEPLKKEELLELLRNLEKRLPEFDSDKLQKAYNLIEELLCIAKAHASAPKPDPFEAWWKKGESMCDCRVPKIFAWMIWDAAIKHGKGEK